MSHCLRPRQIINPHFNPKTTLGAKNLRVWRVANNSPQGYPEDYQILIDCGKCLGCLRDKARSWRVRLLHEHMFGNHDSCTCLTLTIAPEYYEQFQTKAGMASAMRAFIDRLRYYTPGRRSPKRFFISELGEERGRLHFHGFVWDCNISKRDLDRSWRYGFICAQPLRSARQLSYATKYITKPAVGFHKPTIFVSPGLGQSYCNQEQWRSWHKKGNANDPLNFYCKFDSFVYAMPRYYRTKIFTDDEIRNFKVLLSKSERPFEKVLGRQTYTEPLSYAQDRAELLEVTLRSGKSKPITPEPRKDSLREFNPYDDTDEFTLDLYPF